MPFDFDDLLRRASAVEQRSFSAPDFIQYADDLLSQASDYQDLWLDRGVSIDDAPSMKECVSSSPSPLSYDELRFVVSCDA